VPIACQAGRPMIGFIEPKYDACKKPTFEAGQKPYQSENIDSYL
jgi:hypothetical protein